jgi:hypothetical protein
VGIVSNGIAWAKLLGKKVASSAGRWISKIISKISPAKFYP